MLWLRFSHFQYPKFYFQYSKFHFPYSSYSIALHCNSIAMRFSHSIIYFKIFPFSVFKLQFSSFQIPFSISKLSNSLAPNNNSIAIYVLSNRFSHLIICIKKFPFFPSLQIEYNFNHGNHPLSWGIQFTHWLLVPLIFLLFDFVQFVHYSDPLILDGHIKWSDSC